MAELGKTGRAGCSEAPPAAALAASCRLLRPQAAEKAIKAHLIRLAIDFPKHGSRGHDLVALAGLVPLADPMKMMCEALAAVTPWATAFRYPSDDPATELRLTVQEVEGRLDQVDTLIRILKTTHQDGSPS